MAQTDVFTRVPVPTVKRSYFNNSHDVKFDCDMGQIIPFLNKMLLPGDYIKIGNELVVRAQPLAAPILHEVNVQTYYFVVPLRCLHGEMVFHDENHIDAEWDIDEKAFERFMTRGVDGTDETVVMPRWLPTGNAIVNDNNNGTNTSDVNVTTTDNGLYSLWDYLGYPIGVIPSGATPLDYSRRAYNFIYNEYFVDRNVMPKVDVASNSKVLQACWKKDYFTSALPWVQRGPDVHLPLSIALSGLLPVVFSGSVPVTLSGNAPVSFSGTASSVGSHSNRLNGNGSTGLRIGWQDTSGNLNYGTDYVTGSASLSGVTGSGNVSSVSGSVDVSDASALAPEISVNDLRLAVSLQHFLEKMAIGGSRYREFLLINFGLSPRDDRLQRPQFIGGSTSPVIISEVLQTSQTTTGDTGSPQGNLSGHGLVATRDYIAKYHCLEYSVLIGVMVIRPKSVYSQGIQKEFLARTRYDMYLPSLNGLGYQPIEQAELYATDNDNLDSSGNPKVFGYTGRYNEFRFTPSRVAGGMRSTFDYWHLAREFANAPSLNGSFLKCIPDKRIFLVQDEPGFIVDIGNVLHMWRPLPHYPIPGIGRI